MRRRQGMLSLAMSFDQIYASTIDEMTFCDLQHGDGLDGILYACKTLSDTLRTSTVDYINDTNLKLSTTTIFSVQSLHLHSHFRAC